jgi:hypothetical protein
MILAQKPSVIQVRTQRFLLEEIADFVVFAVSQYREEPERGAILTIDAEKARVRLLPL